PGLPAVRAADNPPLFDRADHHVRQVSTHRETLHVAHIGRAGEGPLLGVRQGAELFALTPGVAAVGAVKHRRRPGPHPQLARRRLLGDRPALLVYDAAVDLLPGLAGVFAAE